MDTQRRSKRDGDESSEAHAGSTASADSGSVGSRGDGTGVWINERGETCIGTKCFELAVDEARGEIRVNIKRSGGECQLDPLIEKLQRTLNKPSRTVYELQSEFK